VKAGDRTSGVGLQDGPHDSGLDNASPPAPGHDYERWLRAVPAGIRRNRTGCCTCSTARQACRFFPSKSARPAEDIPTETGFADPNVHPAIAPAQGPHRFPVDQGWGLNDGRPGECRAAVEGLRNDGIFTQPSTRGTL